MQKRRMRGLNRRLGAFTLIELLVVIAIIAVLMGVLMPALNRVREQARQQSCGTRVRQHVLALNMYANENDGQMPRPESVGYWLQDLGRNVANYMLRTGMEEDIFYCPSNSVHQKYMDYFWTFSGGEFNGQQFTNSGYLVSGYCYLLWKAEGRGPIRRLTRDSLKPEWIKSVMQDRPTDRELVIDSCMGQQDSQSKYGYNFAEITIGGITDEYGVPERSSHLTGEGLPIGGNIGFLDGHVVWRKFDPEFENDGTTAKTRTPGTDHPGYFW